MLFTITKDQEEAIKKWMQFLKIPHTKTLPVRYGGFVYNLRRINEAARKANKRGGSMIREVRITADGVLIIDYSEHGSKGRFYLKPLNNFNPLDKEIPKATTTFDIRKEKVTA